MQKSFKSLTGVLLAGLINIVQADPAIEENEMQIRFEEGMSVEALYRRIQSKASIGCRSDMVLAQQRVRHQRECEREFVAAAVNQFGVAELTALHESRTAVQSKQVAASE